jgi:cytochrome c biogenesis protein CcmG, thiol:disulfide interchange protein DsbE
MKRGLWALGIAVPLLLLLALGFQHDPNAHASTLLNKPAPTFTLRSINGEPLSLSRYRGHPVILNFWASWCPGCRVEHQYLVQAWQQYRPAGVQLVGIAFHDTSPDLRSYMHRYGGGWPTAQDPGEDVAISYGVAAPPETFFIDSRGVVRYKVTGSVSPQVLTKEIRRLLRMGT